MNVEQAQVICATYKCHCNISATIWKNKEPEWSFDFWGLNAEQVREIKRTYDLPDFEKLYRRGDEDWRINKTIFNQVRKCKIVGYNEEQIEAHVKKTPIYDCGEEENTK